MHHVAHLFDQLVRRRLADLPAKSCRRLVARLFDNSELFASTRCFLYPFISGFFRPCELPSIRPAVRRGA